jgi:hypothetical protein
MPTASPGERRGPTTATDVGAFRPMAERWRCGSALNGLWRPRLRSGSHWQASPRAGRGKTSRHSTSGVRGRSAVYRQDIRPRERPSIGDRTCTAQKQLGLRGPGCARRSFWVGRRDLRRRQLQRTRPALEFRPRPGPTAHDLAQRQEIESETAAASQQGCFSVHLMAQVPNEVEACAHLVRDQERKPRSSPSELIGRDRCAFRFGAQSPMRSDSILGHWPGSWRCVRANAPPSRRRRRGDEQVRQPQSQFSRSARAGDATTAASLTP